MVQLNTQTFCFLGTKQSRVLKMGVSGGRETVCLEIRLCA